MCGIAGIYSIDGTPLRNLNMRIHKMAELLRHRGPDSTDSHVDSDNRFAFANTRLAISDPTSSITQPWMSEDHNFLLTFNGEIYNDLYLKEYLIAKGFNFQSNQDTEVLFNGLIQSGEDFLSKIDGMWALGFFNKFENSLILSRDILGERQVFYHIIGNEIIFASEMNPILNDLETTFSFDIDQVLYSLRYGAPQPGKTLISGINKLNPGHILKIKNREVNTYRFDRLRPERWFDFFETNPKDEIVEKKLTELFADVSLRRIPRDIPYISTLSAGIDSTLVSLYASEFGNTNIETLFASSKEDDLKTVEFDSLKDRDASKKIASQINSTHHEVQLDSKDAAYVLEKVASNSYDGMLEEGTAAFQMLGIRGREIGMKVMLVSDGPDEFLGGYPQDVKVSHKKKSMRDLPFRFSPNHETNDSERMSLLFPEYKFNEAHPYFGSIDNCYDSLLPELDISQLIALSYASYSIPDYNNLRSDRGFMAASVESRSPFLAPEMAEFLIALPQKFRFNDKYSSKSILRNLIDRYLGSYISNRPKKGFSEPLWYNKDLQIEIQFNETINNSEIFKLLPFSESFLKFPYKEPFHKIRWSMYALSKMNDNLKNRNFSF